MATDRSQSGYCLGPTPLKAPTQTWHVACSGEGTAAQESKGGSSMMITENKATNDGQSGQRALKVRTRVRAGLAGTNHNQRAFKVRTRVRAGLAGTNHNQRALKVRTRVRAGLAGSNHNGSR